MENFICPVRSFVRIRNILETWADVVTMPVTDDRMTTMVDRMSYSAREGAREMDLKA